MDNINDKIHKVETLQVQELKVYEKFMISIEKRVREILPQLNQPELLNEMVAEKKNLMNEISVIEENLSPLRKEIAGMSSGGQLDGLIEPRVIEKIKQTDMNIIDVISKISRIEQELTHKIKEHMDIIKDRLQTIGQQKKLQNSYKPNINNNMLVFNKVESGTVSSFDSAG